MAKKIDQISCLFVHRKGHTFFPLNFFFYNLIMCVLLALISVHCHIHLHFESKSLSCMVNPIHKESMLS